MWPVGYSFLPLIFPSANALMLCSHLFTLHLILYFCILLLSILQNSLILRTTYFTELHGSFSFVKTLGVSKWRQKHELPERELMPYNHKKIHAFGGNF